MLDELRADMAADIMDALGVASTYTPQGGTSVEITVRHYQDVEFFDEHDAISAVTDLVGISVDDVPDVSVGDTIQIGERSYRIGRLAGKSGRIRRYRIT